ncbi:hypothetical protein [Jannaschia sp. AI_61]|uniref:hypothetical protein n=1 Tax=Jannaschia sp. AI_61 TaxID=2829796 RepID=UPI001C7D0554|nr:hypothetical protein [Jannaschia sp. AI_61]
MSAWVAFVFCLMVQLAFSRTAWAKGVDPSIDPLGAAIRAFGQAMFWGTGSYAWRMGYWDLFRSFFAPEAWAAWNDASGGLTINAVWNASMIWAGYQALVGLQLSLPDQDRDQWRWWNVVGYPPWRLFIRLRAVLSALAQFFKRKASRE